MGGEFYSVSNRRTVIVIRVALPDPAYVVTLVICFQLLVLRPSRVVCVKGEVVTRDSLVCSPYRSELAVGVD
jgi:hypothetical protein